MKRRDTVNAPRRGAPAVKSPGIASETKPGRNPDGVEGAGEIVKTTKPFRTLNKLGSSPRGARFEVGASRSTLTPIFIFIKVLNHNTLRNFVP